MSRVELHPDFQTRSWESSRTNRILRVNNQLKDESCWIPAPYALVVDALACNKEHTDKQIMQGYWNVLHNTKRLWMESSSRVTILQMADKLVTRFKPINKIVCFGLGALNHDNAFYVSSLQHMTAFSIAKHLELSYRKRNYQKSPIKIILQDPCYTKKDQQLLAKLYQGGKLTFVSDPDDLLAIDPNTIVLTVFLPFGYPLMQVMADVFHGKEGEGPAVIICDSMDIDAAQDLYSLCDRASREVARFPKHEYVVTDFKDHAIEPELVEDVFGRDGADRLYWLSSMQFYTRRNR